MSKKSRRRNKKILAALALAGGAALMAKNKRIRATDSPGNEFAKARATMTDLPDYNPPKNWITKKAADVVEPAVTLRKPPIGRMRGVGTDAEAIAAQDLRAGLSNRVRGVLPPSQLLTPQRIHQRGVGLRMKSGGRVTGAAKRGFGRALMKGKK